MDCPSCRAVHPAAAAFCTQCGTRLAAVATGVDPQVQQAAQSQPRSYLIEAILVTLCCCQIFRFRRFRCCGLELGAPAPSD